MKNILIKRMLTKQLVLNMLDYNLFLDFMHGKTPDIPHIPFEVNQNINIEDFREIYTNGVKPTLDENISDIEASMLRDLGNENLFKAIFSMLKYDSSFENVKNIINLAKNNTSNNNLFDGIDDTNLKNAADNLYFLVSTIIREMPDNYFNKIKELLIL